MGFLDVLLGRTRPVKPNLDVLFAIPSAALTLQAALDLTPTGVGAVCFRSAEGPIAARAEADLRALLATDPAADTRISRDAFGYTWVTCHRPDGDVSALVTDLHAANVTLTEAGFGPSLLCTVAHFRGCLADQARRLTLVYLFKRGTVYPFAPTGERGRDTALELQVRAQLAGDLPIEADLTRWFPIWDAPGL